MQKVKLPLKVDPVRSAQKRLDYDGIIVAGKLERLSEATVGVNSDAEVKLSFDVDAQGLKIVQVLLKSLSTLNVNVVERLFRITVKSSLRTVRFFTKTRLTIYRMLMSRYWLTSMAKLTCFKLLKTSCFCHCLRLPFTIRLIAA